MWKNNIPIVNNKELNKNTSYSTSNNPNSKSYDKIDDTVKNNYLNILQNNKYLTNLKFNVNNENYYNYFDRLSELKNLKNKYNISNNNFNNNNELYSSFRKNSKSLISNTYNYKYFNIKSIKEFDNNQDTSTIKDKLSVVPCIDNNLVNDNDNLKHDSEVKILCNSIKSVDQNYNYSNDNTIKISNINYINNKNITNKYENNIINNYNLRNEKRNKEKNRIKNSLSSNLDNQSTKNYNKYNNVLPNNSLNKFTKDNCLSTLTNSRVKNSIYLNDETEKNALIAKNHTNNSFSLNKNIISPSSTPNTSDFFKYIASFDADLSRKCFSTSFENNTLEAEYESIFSTDRKRSKILAAIFNICIMIYYIVSQINDKNKLYRLGLLIPILILYIILLIIYFFINKKNITSRTVISIILTFLILFCNVVYILENYFVPKEVMRIYYIGSINLCIHYFVFVHNIRIMIFIILITMVSVMGFMTFIYIVHLNEEPTFFIMEILFSFCYLLVLKIKDSDNDNDRLSFIKVKSFEKVHSYYKNYLNEVNFELVSLVNGRPLFSNSKFDENINHFINNNKNILKYKNNIDDYKLDNTINKVLVSNCDICCNNKTETKKPQNIVANNNTNSNFNIKDIKDYNCSSSKNSKFYKNNKEINLNKSPIDLNSSKTNHTIELGYINKTLDPNKNNSNKILLDQQLCNNLTQDINNKNILDYDIHNTTEIIENKSNLAIKKISNLTANFASTDIENKAKETFKTKTKNNSSKKNNSNNYIEKSVFSFCDDNRQNKFSAVNVNKIISEEKTIGNKDVIKNNNNKVCNCEKTKNNILNSEITVDKNLENEELNLLIEYNKIQYLKSIKKRSANSNQSNSIVKYGDSSSFKTTKSPSLYDVIIEQLKKAQKEFKYYNKYCNNNIYKINDNNKKYSCDFLDNKANFYNKNMFLQNCNYNSKQKQSVDYNISNKHSAKNIFNPENNGFIDIGQFIDENQKNNPRYLLVQLRLFSLVESKIIIDIVIKDVTKIYEVERQVAEAKIKQKVFSKLAHEFKTPFIVIGNELRETGEILNSLNIYNFNVNNELKNLSKRCELLESLSQYTLFLIDDVIQYSSNFKKLSFNLEDDVKLDDIGIFCLNILNGYKSFLPGNKGTIVTSLNMDPDINRVNVKTDPLRLKQILLNFISNSVKFTKSGNIMIDISYERISNYVVICIEDTGVGIMPELLNKLKLVLNNNNENSNENNEIIINTEKEYNQMGSGLGISICKNVVSKLPGHSIFIESEKNKGTKVIIKITTVSINYNLSPPKQTKIKAKDAIRSPCKNHNNSYNNVYSFYNNNPNTNATYSSNNYIAINDDNKSTISDTTKVVHINNSFVNCINNVYCNDNLNFNNTKLINCSSNVYSVSNIENFSLSSNILSKYNKLNTNNLKRLSIDANANTNNLKPSSFCFNNNLNSNSSLLNINNTTHSNIQIINMNKEKFKILIVDDSLSIRKALARLLTTVIDNTKYEIIQGEDGIDIIKLLAYDFANDKIIKLVFTDENMDVLNGSEAIKLAKKLEISNKINKTSFISLTAFTDEGTINNILSSGADKVIAKPCKKKDLEIIIKEYL